MPFHSNAHEIVGELDSKWSPTVVIEFLINGTRVGRMCHLDTGCGDQVVVTDFNFAAQTLGLRFSTMRGAPRVKRSVANGTQAWYVLARATINWFSDKPVTVLAPEPNPATTTASLQSPLILLGVPLLQGTQLAIDFLSQPGVVRITAPPLGYQPLTPYSALD